MKHIREDEICASLNHDNINLVELAIQLGKNALPHLKKIISSNHAVASKAIMLQKILGLIHHEPGKEKTSVQKRKKFSSTMRSISTTNPEGHIKGFSSDMIRRKR